MNITEVLLPSLAFRMNMNVIVSVYHEDNGNKMNMNDAMSLMRIRIVRNMNGAITGISNLKMGVNGDYKQMSPDVTMNINDRYFSILV